MFQTQTLSNLYNFRLLLLSLLGPGTGVQQIRDSIRYNPFTNTVEEKLGRSGG